MTTIIMMIALAVVAAALACGITLAAQRSMARTRAKEIVADAEREADDIKRTRELEGREEAMKITTEAEKQAARRQSQADQRDAKLKQRELQLNQQQSENQRARNEIESRAAAVEAREAAVEARRGELDKLVAQAREQLEHISGLSSEEAREKLVESLRDEAKTAAAGYINDIMDEAKLTANKEAKRIVVQSIQRVATETAIENSVTVFHIDSDE
ncbi:MAG: Rnase Y domain-containing protein, partial [Muribaculaceae bacterium]|nr:Rnase Y domain-containing protein [Muribaculaceae bacterium]